MAELRVKGTGTLKLFESDNTSSVTIASPASLSANKTITLPDADVTLASGTMLATDGSGASLTSLNASELGSGTVPTARLGSGTASSSTVLYGDQTYKAEPGGGKILQEVTGKIGTGSQTTTSSTWQTRTAPTCVITPTATDSRIYLIGTSRTSSGNNYFWGDFRREISGGASTDCISGATYGIAWNSHTNWLPNYQSTTWLYVDAPSTTSEITYKFNFRNSNNSTSVMLGAGGAGSSITALEIGA
jgi:hypothetical protein